jgi:hypothetical protein
VAAPLLFLRTLALRTRDDLSALVDDLEEYLYEFRATAKA